MEALAVADRNLQREALSSELSDNTRTAYQKGWSRFTDYCVAEHIADPLSASPGEVSRFFVHLATRPSPHSGVIPSMGTVVLYKSAVNKKYLEAGKPSPTNHPVVRSTLKGLARLKGLLKPKSRGASRIPHRSHVAIMSQYVDWQEGRRNHCCRIRRSFAPIRDMQSDCR